MTVYLTNRKTGHVHEFKHVRIIKSIDPDIFSLSYKGEDGFISTITFSTRGYELDILK